MSKLSFPQFPIENALTLNDIENNLQDYKGIVIDALEIGDPTALWVYSHSFKNWTCVNTSIRMYPDEFQSFVKSFHHDKYPIYGFKKDEILNIRFKL